MEQSPHEPYKQFYALLEGHRPNDIDDANKTLSEIFDHACDGDMNMLETLASRVGGSDMLCQLWRMAKRSRENLFALIDACKEFCDGNVMMMRDFVRSAGGVDKALQVFGNAGKRSTRNNGRDNVKMLVGVFGYKGLESLGDQLLEDDVLEKKYQSLQDEFRAQPTDETFALLLRNHLLHADKVIEIKLIGGGAKGQKGGGKDEKTPSLMQVTLSTTGIFDGDVFVVALCEVPDIEQKSVTIGGLSLLIGKRQFTPGDSKSWTKLVDPVMIWMAWLDAERSRHPAIQKKRRETAANLVNVCQYQMIPDGNFGAYQANNDKVSAAQLDGEITCFSFSCGLKSASSSIRVDGVWVLHVHCQEVSVKNGVCTDFKVLAAVIKQKTKEIGQGDSDTLLVQLDGGGQDEATELLFAPIFQLVDMCMASKPKILHIWNDKRRELTENAKHVTIYERHNVADPMYDMPGWAASLCHDRIPFMFQKIDCQTHVDEVQKQLDRLAELAAHVFEGDPINYALLTPLQLMAEDLVRSVFNAACELKGIKRETREGEKPREIQVEQFDLKKTLNIGMLGKFMVTRIYSPQDGTWAVRVSGDWSYEKRWKP